jgi:hypothetical protein
MRGPGIVTYRTIGAFETDASVQVMQASGERTHASAIVDLLPGYKKEAPGWGGQRV